MWRNVEGTSKAYTEYIRPHAILQVYYRLLQIVSIVSSTTDRSNPYLFIYIHYLNHDLHPFISSSSKNQQRMASRSRLQEDDVTWNQIQGIKFQIHTTSMIHSYLHRLKVQQSGRSSEMSETFKTKVPGETWKCQELSGVL